MIAAGATACLGVCLLMVSCSRPAPSRVQGERYGPVVVDKRSRRVAEIEGTGWDVQVSRTASQSIIDIIDPTGVVVDTVWTENGIITTWTEHTAFAVGGHTPLVMKVGTWPGLPGSLPRLEFSIERGFGELGEVVAGLPQVTCRVERTTLAFVYADESTLIATYGPDGSLAVIQATQGLTTTSDPFLMEGNEFSAYQLPIQAPDRVQVPEAHTALARGLGRIAGSAFQDSPLEYVLLVRSMDSGYLIGIEAVDAGGSALAREYRSYRWRPYRAATRQLAADLEQSPGAADDGDSSCIARDKWTVSRAIDSYLDDVGYISIQGTSGRDGHESHAVGLAHIRLTIQANSHSRQLTTGGIADAGRSWKGESSLAIDGNAIVIPLELDARDKTLRVDGRLMLLANGNVVEVVVDANLEVTVDQLRCVKCEPELSFESRYSLGSGCDDN